MNGFWIKIKFWGKFFSSENGGMLMGWVNVKPVLRN